jgi:hypothetical protein
MLWCGYIDMLGTRAMASRSSEELIRNLDYFHATLSENFKFFKNGRCSAFSDGAFFVAGEPTAFQPFYQRVRNMLFQRGLFFRCSFIEGDIPMMDHETDESGNYLAKSPPSFRSFTFSGSAPDAYQRESMFKGVGCTVAKANGEKKLQNTVTSFYLRSDGGKLSAVEYLDFRYSEFELSEPPADTEDDSWTATYAAEQRIVDPTVLACHTALTQSTSVGSYFLPVFVSMIRSSDLSNVTYNVSGGGWENAPYLFRQLVDGGATKALKDLPGLHLLLLACFDKLYRDCDGTPPKAVRERVLHKLMRHPNCFRNLDRIPDFVISGSARNELVKLRAAATLDAPLRTRRSVTVA